MRFFFFFFLDWLLILVIWNDVESKNQRAHREKDANGRSPDGRQFPQTDVMTEESPSINWLRNCNWFV